MKTEAPETARFLPSVRGSRVALLTCLVASIALVGCVSGRRGMETNRKSSTVNFLYPKNAGIAVKPTVPHLTLPIDVGIAFVPETGGSHRDRKISEEHKDKLLQAVAGRFKDRPFIRKIEIIPTTYLNPGGGFANIEQIRSMFGIDVIALVAYDQIQHTDDDALSLAYLTVIGMYLINGEKNDTSTMLDTSVFHIPSRKLLFRAPGTSRIKGRATAINVSERLRRDAGDGMAQANSQMITNLTAELDRFKQRVKESPDEVKITHAPGYTGAGNLGALFPLSVCLLLLGSTRRNGSRKS